MWRACRWGRLHGCTHRREERSVMMRVNVRRPRGWANVRLPTPASRQQHPSLTCVPRAGQRTASSPH